jgi:hypothetical protein
MDRITNALLISCLFVFVSCQNKPVKEFRFITGKGDTLTGPLVSMLDPGSKADSIHYRDVLVRLGLTQNVEDRRPDSLDSMLANQLSLESGVEWSIRAANLLCDAACEVRAKLEVTGSCSATVAFAESLFQIVNTEKRFSFPTITNHPPEPNKMKWISKIFSEIFNIDDPTATALTVFTNEQSPALQMDEKVQLRIKGLLFDTTTNSDTMRAAKHSRKTSQQLFKSEKDILKYRDQNSIIDSITRHIPEIKSLYKKHLKRNENLSGTVTVTFILTSSGKVLEVSVAKTDIVDNGFIGPLLNYLKLISFKSIPEDVGNMKFEFPFEFDRDM